MKVRVAYDTDDGGYKVSVGRGMWSAPMDLAGFARLLIDFGAAGTTPEDIEHMRVEQVEMGAPR